MLHGAGRLSEGFGMWNDPQNESMEVPRLSPSVHSFTAPPGFHSTLTMVVGHGFFLSLPLSPLVVRTGALRSNGVRILLTVPPRGMGRGIEESMGQRSKWGQEAGCGPRSG